MPNIETITAWINANLILSLGVSVFLGVVFLTLAVTGIVSREKVIRRRALQPFVVGNSDVLSDRKALGHDNAMSIAKTLSRVSAHFKATDGKELNELRKKLRAAGFFDSQALGTFYASRIILGIGLPLAMLIIIPVIASEASYTETLLVITVCAGLGFFLPKAFLDNRINSAAKQHRNGFPDFLDLMVVSTEAGISVEAAIDRVGQEMTHSYPKLAAQLYILNLELRAGKSFPDALEAFADNITIEEAKSFATLIQQSQELGSSLVDALRVYSDEMRDKRLSRAEEKAHALPALLVIPLGMFIFPVMLVVTMLPVLVRINNAFF
ncbi:MAG: type II secretion system F family protein [Hyphomicrobiales bacterium]|nr:type II secretion system F family protein [Hyphomicrobiales bacterium]